MNKIQYFILLLIFALLSTSSVAYALLTDSASLSFDLSTADFEVRGPLTILENKPINVDDFEPGEWSEYGRLRISNDLPAPANFYMYVTETDGNICHSVNILLEVSDNGTSDWVEVYEGEIEDIRGNNDRVALTLNEDFSRNSVYLRQKVQFREDARKNDAGKECLWDEVFRIESFEEEHESEHVLSRHNLGATYWMPPIAEIKDPNKNKEYEAGEEIKIKWKAKSQTKDKNDEMRIDLYLYDESGANEVMVIAEDLENDKEYKWTPPSDLLGDDFRIKLVVTDENGLTSEDMSDEDFSLVED